MIGAERVNYTPCQGLGIFVVKGRQGGERKRERVTDRQRDKQRQRERGGGGGQTNRQTYKLTVR